MAPAQATASIPVRSGQPPVRLLRDGRRDVQFVRLPFRAAEALRRRDGQHQARLGGAISSATTCSMAEPTRRARPDSSMRGRPRNAPMISKRPLAEFGQVRESYRRLRTLHEFVKAFGPELAGMPVSLQDGQDRIDPSDSETLRYAVRSDGERVSCPSTTSRTMRACRAVTVSKST